MKRENLHQPFEISFSELDESQLKEHDHTFFELVYILSGTGVQWINNNRFPYHDGHLFMITPGDIHSFDIHTTTKFVYIKFNDIYIHSAVFGAENIQRLEFILQHANHRPGCILRNQTDKLLVRPMIEAIIREYVNRNIYSSEIITQLINTIVIEGGNLAASKIRNLECPSYEICLIDYGCGKFNRKIHIMEQYP